MPSASTRREVAVVGAGMAGLTTAARAVERGADILLVEKGDRAGGSFRLSAGLVWTYDSLGDAREAVPRGDPALQRLVVEGLDEGLAWLESLGIGVREPPVELPTGDTVTAPTPGANCGKVDPDEAVGALLDVVRDGTGEVRLETPMTDLTTSDGRVDGLRVEGPDGPATVDADAVVLATGGFQGDEELLQQHVTPHVENLWLRANPWSTGDGLRAARDVGGTATGGLHTFYGHNLAAPPATVTPDTFLDLTQYYGPFAVALDRSGERYTDESESDLEHTLAQDTARSAGGRAVYVLDRDLYEDDVFSMGRVGTIVERAGEAGAEVVRGTTLDELGAELDAIGFDGETAVATVRDFNEAVRAGTADRLDPPRRENRRTIDRPPFHAVPVQPGITFTMGGLAVDERLRVLRGSASASPLFDYPDRGERLQNRPIPGLLAAGVDVGGVNHRGYMGGLATALVTGLTAAETAVASRS